MQLKIINNEDGIILRNSDDSSISEIIVSSNEISIRIDNHNVYRQSLNKIELSGEWIKIISDITEIIAKKKVEIQTNGAKINSSSNELSIKSDSLEINNKGFYKIDSSMINFYNS